MEEILDHLLLRTLHLVTRIVPLREHQQFELTNKHLFGAPIASHRRHRSRLHGGVDPFFSDYGCSIGCREL